MTLASARYVANALTFHLCLNLQVAEGEQGKKNLLDHVLKFGDERNLGMRCERLRLDEPYVRATAYYPPPDHPKRKMRRHYMTGGYYAGVWMPGSVILSHSCEDVSDGGLVIGLDSSSTSSNDSLIEGVSLTFRFVSSIINWGQRGQ